MYVIRQKDNRTFEIASFEDSKEPNAVYMLTHNKANGYTHCDCPGFRFHRNTPEKHKHVVMFNHWKEQGSPVGLFMEYHDDGTINEYRAFSPDNS